MKLRISFYLVSNGFKDRVNKWMENVQYRILLIFKILELLADGLILECQMRLMYMMKI